ncbi:glutathione S-transferase C-terminal domain-containing protein [Pseudogemmobacter sonorensis]|uniref:glutathione S-transferase C-terminal domain-containing protein n=1 Tax=Pseudogemmobacter sonorensis TaxID=2989681 RepID=UPI0036AAC525
MHHLSRVRMFNTGFGALARPDRDLYPNDPRDRIDAPNERTNPRLNIRVYRLCFATMQLAYEKAFTHVFEMLDELKTHLAEKGPYLLSERLTGANIRLYATPVRFDAAYVGIFKCNLRSFANYPAFSACLPAVFDLPGVRETASIHHIKRG